MGYERQGGRIRRKRTTGVSPKKLGLRAGQWTGGGSTPKQHLAPPPFDRLSDVPADLHARAATEKYPWIKRFVEDGCPRGELLRYAKAYAEAMGKGVDTVPAYTTLNTWVHRYRAFGMLGLVDKPRGDAGASRVLAKLDRAATLLKTALVGGKMNVSAATRFLARHTPQEVAPPSYFTVRREADRLERAEPHLFALARHGLKFFRDHYELALSHGLLPGGYRLSVDSTVCDLWVRIPDPVAAHGWRAVRVVLTVVQDVATRLIVTFNVSLHAVSSGILLGVFRRVAEPNQNWPGLVSTGVPFQVTMDRGAEHQGAFRTTLERLEVDIVRSTDNPKERARMERIFGTINAEVLSQEIGYSPRQEVFDPYAAPEADFKRSLKQLKYEPYRLEVPVTSLRRVEELEAMLLAWATLHNDRPHEGLPVASPDTQAVVAAVRSGRWPELTQHTREVA